MKQIIIILSMTLILISCKESGKIATMNELIFRYDTRTKILTFDNRNLDFKNSNINEITENMGENEKVKYNSYNTDGYVSTIYPIEVTYNKYRINFQLSFLKKGENYSILKGNYDKIKFYFDDILITNNTNIGYLKRELDKKKIVYKVSGGDLLEIEYNPIRYVFNFNASGQRIVDLDCMFAFKPYEEDGFEMGLKKSQ